MNQNSKTEKGADNPHSVHKFVSLRVLVACEFSGIVRDAFAAQGHDAWSCDILPTERPGNHIKGDVLKVVDFDPLRWDLLIAHPPCTYLSNAGVQYLHSRRGRWEQMRVAKEFFMRLLTANIPKIAIENPVPHKYVKLPTYTQIIYPYQHGENKSKRTCLWLKNLPKIKPTKIVDKGEFYKCGNGGTNPKWYSTSAKNRSRTFTGIAEAMATQWGVGD